MKTQKTTKQVNVTMDIAKLENLTEKKLKYMSFSNYVNMLIDNDLAKVIAFIAMLLIIGKAQAQTNAVVSFDVGSEITAPTRNVNLGVAIGIKNWDGEYASVGFITKTYGNKTLCAGRIVGLIRIPNSIVCLYTQGDAFIIHDAPHIYITNGDGRKVDIQHNVTRLELGAGAAINIKNFYLFAGLQFDDYDPITDFRQQPAIFTKLTYNFDLNKQSQSTRTYYRKAINPRGL